MKRILCIFCVKEPKLLTRDSSFFLLDYPFHSLHPSSVRYVLPTMLTLLLKEMQSSDLKASQNKEYY